MIIDFKKLSSPELTEVTQDLGELITKKKQTGAAFAFWYEMLKGIITETDRRIEEDLKVYD